MPLRLLAFDMDGTLVETERLKAQSYARAAADLCGAAPGDVEAAYRDVVGQSRQEVAQALLERFGLADAARQLVEPDEEPWEAFVRIRLEHYRAAIEDDDRVREAARPDARALAAHARQVACSVALVTTSDRPTTDRVLEALGLTDAFDVTVTADDVSDTKPSPEGYRLALDAVGADPADALAIEDSPAGVRAAVAAGVRVLAVPTALTRDRLAALGLEDESLARIVEPENLVGAVREALDAGR